MAEKDEIKTSGYKSPINLVEEVHKELLKERENYIICQIKQVVDVDKDELIKALNYDRGQYEKGYSDGYEDGKREAQKIGRWEIIGEEVGALNIKYPIKKCSECGWTHSLFIPENACPNCGAKMENGGNLFD